MNTIPQGHFTHKPLAFTMDYYHECAWDKSLFKNALMFISGVVLTASAAVIQASVISLQLTVLYAGYQLGICEPDFSKELSKVFVMKHDHDSMKFKKKNKSQPRNQKDPLEETNPDSLEFGGPPKIEQEKKTTHTKEGAIEDSGTREPPKKEKEIVNRSSNQTGQDRNSQARLNVFAAIKLGKGKRELHAPEVKPQEKKTTHTKEGAIEDSGTREPPKKEKEIVNRSSNQTGQDRNSQARLNVFAAIKLGKGKRELHAPEVKPQEKKTTHTKEGANGKEHVDRSSNQTGQDRKSKASLKLLDAIIQGAGNLKPREECEEKKENIKEADGLESAFMKGLNRMRVAVRTPSSEDPNASTPWSWSASSTKTNINEGNNIKPKTPQNLLEEFRDVTVDESSINCDQGDISPQSKKLSTNNTSVSYLIASAMKQTNAQKENYGSSVSASIPPNKPGVPLPDASKGRQKATTTNNRNNYQGGNKFCVYEENTETTSGKKNKKTNSIGALEPLNSNEIENRGKTKSKATSKPQQPAWAGARNNLRETGRLKGMI